MAGTALELLDRTKTPNETLDGEDKISDTALGMPSIHSARILSKERVTYATDFWNLLPTD
jgi:hypothetical protein